MVTFGKIIFHVRKCAAAFQTGLLIAMLLLCASTCAFADDFWKQKPASQWSSAEALRLVRHSPWAKVEAVVFRQNGDQASYSVVTGTARCDTDAALNGTCLQKDRVEPPIDSSQQADAAPRLSPSTSFLVRWESARPVIQAFARLQDLGERQSASFQAPVARRPADRYVITVKLENPGMKGFDPFATASADKSPIAKPKLLAALKTRLGVVSPMEVEFSGIGATSAVHFFFPRTIGGVALLGAGPNSAEFTLVGSGFSVHSKFKLDQEQ